MRVPLIRPGVVATALSVLVVLAAAYLADRQNSALYREQARAEVAKSLSQLRTDMESNLYGSIQLVRGLVGVIASEPDIEQEKFAQIASKLLDGQSQIRNIAGAPDLVVDLMYPLAGNEAAIGLDYMQNPDQRDAVVAAMELGTVVLAGPVDLVQGGSGFIVRYPVFRDRQDRSGTEPWGLIAAVIDVDEFFAKSGLLSSDLPVQVALTGRDGVLKHGSVFFGDAGVLSQEPVTTQVSLPVGGWQIAAIPRDGWKSVPSDAWLFRTMLFVAGLLVVLPITFAGYLHDQLRARSGKLAHRESEMNKLSQRLDLALETSKIGIWELDLESGRLRWDRRMKELYGVANNVEPDAVEHWIHKLHPDGRAKAVAEFEDAVESRQTYRSVFRIVPREGTTRWIRTIGSSHQDCDGRNIIIGVNWDVSEELQLKTELIEANKSAELRNTELEEARVQMEHNSLHDVLTGLPNRRFLDERVFGADADVCPTALVHIDLDRFKQINDTLGHAAGDAMLVHAARILRQNTRGSDLVARVGGDEFVVVITDIVDKDWLERFADAIITQMQRPVRYKDQMCRFGASIGITIADGDFGASNSQMLIDADLALYRAKKWGRNRYEFFDASLKAEIMSQKQLADDILTALERQEFVPYFQPQFDATSLDISGVEAVARWNHPTRGVLAPSAFLEMAEELSVVHHIDRMILLKTLFQSRRWETAGLQIPRKSVNVSAGHLNDPELMKLLHGLPITPGELSFELLESIFLDDENETVAQNIANLSDLGIDIELDDFGTGHASIIGLLHLNPSRLKIERRLIKPIVTCDRQRKIVSSIIEIGKSLGIEVVAEGVETLDHVVVLRELGCDTLQGFALAMPMTTTEFIEFATTEAWRQKAA